MTHTSRHGGCGASRAAGVIPRRSTAPAARCVGVGRGCGADPFRSPRPRPRAVVRERGSASRSREHLGTPDLGAGMRQLRAPDTPPGARSTASCSRPAFPRGRVEGRGHIARAGTRRLPAPWSPTRDRPRLHSGPAPYRPRAKTGLRSSRPAWTGSVRVPGAGQVNEREAQFFSERREHAPAEGLVATQGVATAPAT